ncbi:uncharacterized protein LOC106066590 isoform X1 [Biomphalaria glabrata]|uniref:Uncharacterized protein LOC106066590 isoform X1 n=1 Tax=Biomphalaria glabrata TaxID=6526 RepID=A0A9U8EBY5_BIOGL|nr:uncharacterized protein LOC106066590 isoform X1 [Biomphalaria glabrata]
MFTVLIFTCISLVQMSAAVLTKDSACNVTKGCLSQCDLSNNCFFTLSWQLVNGTVTFVMSTTYTNPNTSGGVYMAVGLSYDQKMGNDSVIGCANQGDSFKAFAAYNRIADTPEQYNDTEVILQSYNNSNGVITCTVTRPITGLNKRFDLARPMFILFVTANATIAGDTITIYSHGETDFMTAIEVNVSSVVDLKPYEEPEPLTKDTACKITKGCLSECGATNCDFTLSWQVVGATATFTMSTIYSNPVGVYMAVGFSDDHKMGNDSVFGCARQGTDFKAFAAKNVAAGVTPEQYNDDNVVLLTSSFDEGITKCVISRPLAGNSNRFDISQQWVLFFVYGNSTISNNVVTLYSHGETDYMTDVKISASSIVDLEPHEIQDTNNTGNGGPRVTTSLAVLMLLLTLPFVMASRRVTI